MFQNKKLASEIRELKRRVTQLEADKRILEYQVNNKPKFTKKVHDLIVCSFNVALFDSWYLNHVSKIDTIVQIQYSYNLFNKKTKQILTDIPESELTFYQENKEQSVLNA